VISGGVIHHNKLQGQEGLGGNTVESLANPFGVIEEADHNCNLRNPSRFDKKQLLNTWAGPIFSKGHRLPLQFSKEFAWGNRWHEMA
jgi:hypothetical protein